MAVPMEAAGKVYGAEERQPVIAMTATTANQRGRAAAGATGDLTSIGGT
jgi:hypothetical protein